MQNLCEIYSLALVLGSKTKAIQDIWIMRCKWEQWFLENENNKILFSKRKLEHQRKIGRYYIIKLTWCEKDKFAITNFESLIFQVFPGNLKS